jgi:citrate lyase subunit beta / citryl-CoA lyase
MRLRSLLFVPGDSPRKFEKAYGVGADALILDLEDSVALGAKPEARAHVASLIDQRPRDWGLFVRPNPADSGLLDADLDAVVKPGLDTLMIPKAEGAADIAAVAAKLDALEAKRGMQPGTVKIAVVATETPRAVFGLASYTPPHLRLIALTWGAEDLGAAVGATANRDDSGQFTEPYRMVRSLCLFAAASAGVAPVETLYADFRDLAGLEADSRAARRDGFVGRMAIHPDQVAVINAAFSPTEAEIDHARRIVEAFAANPGAGTLGLDGKMIDLPHLKAAQRLLAGLS